jgi:uncharacterized membrane protein
VPALAFLIGVVAGLRSLTAPAAVAWGAYRDWLPLRARVVLGGLSGACLAASASQSIAIGSVLGGVGGVAGAFAGYEARTRLGRALKAPDFVIACLEDATAIASGLLIVWRS